MEFIGRENELKKLTAQIESPRQSASLIYGR